MFDLNNLNAEKRLGKIPELMCIIRNKEIEERALQAEADRIDEKLKKCIQARDEAKIELYALEETIEAMPTNRYKDMLKQHYVDGETWESLIKVMHYSASQIYNFRPLAIKEFDDKWNEKMK